MKMDLGMLGFCRVRKTFRPLNKRHSYFIAMHTAPNKDLRSLGSECPRSGHSGWFEHQERHSFTLNKIQENEEIERPSLPGCCISHGIICQCSAGTHLQGRLKWLGDGARVVSKAQMIAIIAD